MYNYTQFTLFTLFTEKILDLEIKFGNLHNLQLDTFDKVNTVKVSKKCIIIHFLHNLHFLHRKFDLDINCVNSMSKFFSVKSVNCVNSV